MKSVLIAFGDRIGDFGGGFITIDMAAEHALVFHAAGEHFLAQMLGLKRSGLDALNVALEGGFERCRGEMAHGRMPLHFTEGEGDLVWRRFGVRRERHGDHHGSGERSHLHSIFLLTTRPPALQAPRGFRTDYGNRNRLLSGFGEGVINFVFLSEVKSQNGIKTVKYSL